MRENDTHIPKVTSVCIVYTVEEAVKCTAWVWYGTILSIINILQN